MSTAADTGQHDASDPLNVLAGVFIEDAASSLLAPRTSYPFESSSRSQPLAPAQQVYDMIGQSHHDLQAWLHTKVQDMISQSQRDLQMWLHTSSIPTLKSDLSVYLCGPLEGYGAKLQQQLTQDISRNVLATISRESKKQRSAGTTNFVTGSTSSSKRPRIDIDGHDETRHSTGTEVDVEISELQSQLQLLMGQMKDVSTRLSILENASHLKQLTPSLRHYQNLVDVN
jgi:hypothetical protein